MKAILQINGFQKIIDISRPEPYIRQYKDFDMEIVPKYPENIDIEILLFRLRGQVGEFLLYEFEGKI